MLEYRNSPVKVQNDGFSAILKEASEFFQEQKVAMFGTGFEEIVSENALFNSYVEKLCEGLPADELASTQQLLENCRLAILQEASISGIQPYASLSMPTVRKMWTRVAMKNVVPTEAVKVPKFVISWMEPYLKDSDGTKHSLPAAFKNPATNGILGRLKPLACGVMALPLDGVDLLTVNGQTRLANDTLSPKFYVSKVVMEVTDASGANPENKTVDVKFERDMRGNIMGVVTAAHTDTTINTDTLFGHVDIATGLINATSLKGTIQSIEVVGHLSPEANERSQQVSFDIQTKDVTVPPGQHINAPLPVEWLTDLMALYNIDGATSVVELMSNVVAQALDFELIKFLDDSYTANGATYNKIFNVRPSAAFAFSQKEWREELKTVINWLALKIQNDSSYYNGVFVVYGHPIDVELITNVNWVFTSTADERGGVKVGYNIGAYSGTALKYLIVSTPNVPAGELRMIFIPDAVDLMTYKYYPYSFNIEKGYLDPQMPNVPSIMMTKRHTMEELVPLCGRITIVNNDGTLPASAP